MSTAGNVEFFAGRLVEDELPERLPGDKGLWIFVVGDLAEFFTFFCLYLYARSAAAGEYSYFQGSLNLRLGVLNTLLLLTSSLFVVIALHCARQNNLKRGANFLAAAFACGLGFVVVKAIEYSEKIQAGFDLSSNGFISYYFTMTGFHLLHVAVGMTFIAVLHRTLRRGFLGDRTLINFESVAIYWHMVDFLWVVIFALLYLIR